MSTDLDTNCGASGAKRQRVIVHIDRSSNEQRGRLEKYYNSPRVREGHTHVSRHTRATPSRRGA
ncbi:hypothetical protein ZHAS_00006473 [Anopheles sinensis]|uniref:Uncharacterized protein n=1 Tax=Anopheles sinensis TaxID=74873 RepID=A0A084VME8_ANOSI|nr:hypothetical protein ZHAS_00006473 [Anopheles sinensis]